MEKSEQIICEKEFKQKNVHNCELFKNTILDAPKAATCLRGGSESGFFKK